MKSSGCDVPEWMLKLKKAPKLVIQGWHIDESNLTYFKVVPNQAYREARTNHHRPRGKRQDFPDAGAKGPIQARQGRESEEAG